MNSGDRGEILVPTPFQLIDFDGGIAIKRGRTQLLVQGPGAVAAILQILQRIMEKGATKKDLIEAFEPREQPAITRLIGQLVDRRFLISREEAPALTEADEYGSELLIWDLETRTVGSKTGDGLKRVVIFGVNCVSRQLVSQLAASRMRGMRVSVVDYPLLRNIRFFDEHGSLAPKVWPDTHPRPETFRDMQTHTTENGDGSELFVPTSDFGGRVLCEPFNTFAVRSGLLLLPIVLQDYIGFVGPFVTPGETPCYSCFLARVRANSQDPDIRAVIDQQAHCAQHVTGFLPSMAAVLGDVAACEIEKCYLGIGGLWNRSQVLLVDLWSSTMTSHRVLRVPGCEVCSKLRYRPAISVVSRDPKDAN